jgi:DNA repair exonuclease SbcCD nuclease subunit
MDFTFIHAADLHIDSPFAALGRKNAEAAAFFAQASRRAVQALVDQTIQSKAAFLVIAGDVFDGDWADVSTGLFLMREFVRLERANVPVIMLRGNHDAESRMSRGLKWPDNVMEFSTRKAESFELAHLRTVLHGRGFPDRAVEADFVRSYPPRRDGWLNIGVLHTSLEGNANHAVYAPCSIVDLKNFGYDYWALGHVHQAAVIEREPYIVYPGNLQGRSIRETGAKGAMSVSVSDGRIADVQPLDLGPARWAHVEIDIAACDALDDVYTHIHARLGEAHAQADGRALAVRITLTGATSLHDRLLAERVALEEQALGIAERVSAQCWIEKIRLATKPPQTLVPDLETKSLGLGGILDEAAEDAEFAAQFASLAGEIAQKLPPEVRALFEQEVENAGLRDAARHYLAGVLGQGAK